MITAIYHVRGDRESIAARAQAIATEQSVEMPVPAIDDAFVLDRIVGKVLGIAELRPGLFELRIGLATETTGGEAGQLMNMLFGNTSIHDDVTLWDVVFPADLVAAFPGPNVGLAGLRERVGVHDRALTCSALKPQGLPPARLAKIAYGLARGGLDFIKDDHGLADQTYSRFADRVQACAEAVAQAGGRTRYVPNVSGHLDQLRTQVRQARAAGLDMVLIEPMIVGLPAFQALVREFPDIGFMAHPAMAGAARIAPPLLLGKLFRLMGADATIFPNHGGRFGYSPRTCRSLAEAALGAWGDVKACVPVPAGGMAPDRVPEMLEFYGNEVMLLIGGALLAARDRLADEAAAFLETVRRHAR